MPTIKPETLFLSRVNEKITRLNKLYKETIDLHNYYANELWEHFNLIDCCYAEESCVHLVPLLEIYQIVILAASNWFLNG